MCWRKWKLGLVIAVVCGLLTAGAGLMDRMSWKSFIAVLSTALLSNLLNFLKSHPLEDLADDSQAGKPVPVTRVGLLLFCLLFCLLLAAVAVSGCAHMSSATTRTITTNPTNGVVIVTETTHANAYALLDSNAALTKFRNQSSPSTNATGSWAPGTYASGLNENATSTNAVQVLNALSGVLGKIPW